MMGRYDVPVKQTGCLGTSCMGTGAWVAYVQMQGRPQRFIHLASCADIGERVHERCYQQMPPHSDGMVVTSALIDGEFGSVRCQASSYPFVHPK